MNTSPWNKDRIVGQKRPLQISNIWGIRLRLEREGKTRDLTLFNMALDSKLRGCDLVKLKVSDVAYGSSVSSRATGSRSGQYRQLHTSLSPLIRFTTLLQCVRYIQCKPDLL